MTKKIMILIILSGVILAAAATPFDSGATLFLPAVMNGQGSASLPPPDEASARITVPAGFQIRIFAENLPGGPRFMAFEPDGQLLVSLPGAGEIVRLPDRNNDGLADGVEVVASGLNYPHGIEFHDGWLYVAENDRVERLADQDSNGTYETRELVTDNIPGGSGHTTRTVHFGPDGKMYVSAGSSCNYCEESDPRRAAILRFNPDGSIPSDNPFANDADTRKQPLWAWGLRNSVDFLWNSNGTLWADHNGVDGLGDNTPPEEIIIPVQGNAWYGWPYCYTPTLGLNSSPEVRDTRIAIPSGLSCDQAIPALYTAPAHSAPLGMTLGAGPAFPQEYRDSLYIAFHGSWNTGTPANYRDCKIERVILDPGSGQPIGTEDFANGWRASGELCGASTTWGRPADVVFGPYGDMYISDDKGNRVYRVVYQP
jgi:glucose/arabinose dehydrogenase